MVNILNKKDCSGCRACKQICPKNAIKMIEDTEGFWYPAVDKEICINCNLCNKVCHIENENINRDSFNKPLAYAAWNKDEEERKIASSGGSFEAISEYIFSLGGIVCGVGFDENLNVIHKFAKNKVELNEFKGSKYVQSNTNETFSKTKIYLEEGKVVLYTGTPCQISGLRSFLQKEYENLYTCDLVCHGVPSPKVYRKYISEKSKEYNSKVKNICFRDKTTGWKRFSLKMIFENDKVQIEDLGKDKFVQGFLKDVYLRPSCYDCKSSKLPRYSDITLGDFWGVKEKYPELDDDKGTSLLLINTIKGKKLLKNIERNIFLKECDLKHAIKYNSAIISSVLKPKQRKNFFEEVDSKNFEELSKKYFKKNNILRKIFYKIKLRLLNKKY